VIKPAEAGHEEGGVRVPELELADTDAVRPVDLRALVEQHVAFVYRSLRRLGVEEMSLDDATQQVWIVATRRLADIRPASERAFLFGIAVRVAADFRRAARRRRLVPDENAWRSLPTARPSPTSTSIANARGCCSTTSSTR